MLLPPGWANAPLPRWGRGSSDDKRQRETNNPSCGSFRETQVTQTGKTEKKREGKGREKQIETQRECEGRNNPCFTALLHRHKHTRGKMQAFLGFHYFYSSFCLSLQDCLLGSARCVLFQCPLHNFSGQAVLKINARLWNSSFIEVKKTPKNKTSLSSLHQ